MGRDRRVRPEQHGRRPRAGGRRRRARAHVGVGRRDGVRLQGHGPAAVAAERHPLHLRLSVESADGLVWRSLEGQSSVPFTRGFTAWTWAVVAAQAASGYAIGALLKYVDAIGQVFADVIAMLITVVFRVGAIQNLSYVLMTQVTVSTLLFDLDMNFLYAVALLLSAASLGVYYSDLITTALEARRAARARQIELVPPKADAC